MSVMCALVLVCAGVQAVDAGSFRPVTDRMGRGLIESYNVKAKGYGTPEQQKDVELAAMIVAGLCGSSRDYREGHGPFITEPVKLILASVNEDGSLKAPAKDEVATLAWAAKALRSTTNEKYLPLVEKIHAKLKHPPAATNLEAEAQKFSKFETLPPAEQVAVLTVIGHAIKDSAKSEVTVDGAKIGLGQLVLDTLDRAEKKTGKVSEDLRVNALAFNLANATMSAMK